MKVKSTHHLVESTGVSNAILNHMGEAPDEALRNKMGIINIW